MDDVEIVERVKLGQLTAIDHIEHTIIAPATGHIASAVDGWRN